MITLSAHFLYVSSPDKAADIPVSEGVQENDPKYSDAEIVEALVPGDS